MKHHSEFFMETIPQDEWDRHVYELEEMFVVYSRRERVRLKGIMEHAIDQSRGSDEQKDSAKEILTAVLSNVETSTWIKDLRWQDDQIEVFKKLQELTGIVAGDGMNLVAFSRNA